MSKSNNERNRMPYHLESVKDGEVSIVFSEKSHKIKLTPEMLGYLLDAGLRTRISAAGAGKGSGAFAAQAKMAEQLAEGKVGRIGFDAKDILKEIAECEIEDIAKLQIRIQNAPKGRKGELALALSSRAVDLMTS